MWNGCNILGWALMRTRIELFGYKQVFKTQSDYEREALYDVY